MTIVLKDVGSGFKRTAINENFDAIESELNDKVLRRSGLTGGANQMEVDLDMNSRAILNGGLASFGQLTVNGEILDPDNTGVTTLPSQTGNDGQHLVTNGSSALWETDGAVTLSTAVASTTLGVGQSVVISDRAFAVFDVVLASGVTPNTWNIVQCVGKPLLALVLRTKGVLDVRGFGTVGDGVADDTSPIQLALNTGNSIHLNKGDEHLIEGTLSIFNSASRHGQTIYGNNAILIQNETSGTQRCLSVEGFKNHLYDITFENRGTDGVGVALWLYNRRFKVSGLKFFGGWNTCIDASQAIEGSLSYLHIENKAGAGGLVPTGVGIAIIHCLNMQISNSYIGYCETQIGPGANVGGVTHGNEGITVHNNTFVQAGNEQINLQGLWINIHDNVIDSCQGLTGSAILLKGQSIKLTSNWIADAGQDTSTKTLVHFYDGSYQATVKDNTFWRALQQGGAETLISLDMGGDCQFSQVSGNLFAGRMAGPVINSGGNIILADNQYDDGATPLTITGTRSSVQRLDPQTTSYLTSLRLGNDGTSVFNARLGCTGSPGLRAFNFTNDVGTVGIRSGEGDGALLGGYSAADAAIYVGKGDPTNRSINAAGTVNASGADYAEYMVKSDTCGELSKGDIGGIDSEGKLTDEFSEAISFCVKSTDPSYVGGDNWFTEERPVPSSYETEEEFNMASVAFDAAHEVARSRVDRIAFCGQVPINVPASVGDYIIPTELSGAITGAAVAFPSFEQYQSAVGRVIKVVNGTPTIIVKVI